MVFSRAANLVTYVLAFLLVGGMMVVLRERGDNSADLQFISRQVPEGFRQLIMRGSLVGFDTITGPPNSGKRQENRTLSAREICDLLYRDAATPSSGRPDSRVQIVEFFDYRCPYCKTLGKILLEIQAKHDAHIIYKEWPVLGESSMLAARAALAAARQEKYIEFHTTILNSRLVPTPAYIEALALQVGVDQIRLSADMNAEDIVRAIESNAHLASELGLRGTPVLIVGRTVVEGAITGRQLERLVIEEYADATRNVCDGSQKKT